VIVLGLTGSIGMGKSTTLRLFEEEGAKVWDADAAVHRLYAPGGAAVAPIEAAFPSAAGAAGVDRARLTQRIAGDPQALKRLEAIVHPLVAVDRQQFLAENPDAKLVVVDIPLLFEIGADRRVDAVLTVSAPPEVQRARVLARPGMTPEKFETLLARQLPDAEKRARADFVLETDKGLAVARGEVRRIMAEVTAPGWRSIRHA
jgi:dephospho-CoA kinase